MGRMDITMTMLMARAVVVDTEVAPKALGTALHAGCFACGAGSVLGLVFRGLEDGSLACEWNCPEWSQGFTGVVHGGLLATLLDATMVHVLLRRGLNARTGELKVRYRHPVRTGSGVELRGRLLESRPPLHILEATVFQEGRPCVYGQARFMELGNEAEEKEMRS